MGDERIAPIRQFREPSSELTLEEVDLRAPSRLAPELAFLASHDSLTGLANRALLMDSIEVARRRHATHGEPFAILFCDVDRFKLVNDTLGHDVGDTVLRVVAQRLANECRGCDIVGRLGGDEFAVVVTGVASADARQLADRVVAMMREPIEVGHRALPMSISVGVARAREDQADPSDLLRDADAALNEAKARGRDRAECFSPAHAERLRRRAEIERDLRVAIDQRQLCLHYQPMIDLTSGDAVGVEALVRWQHPTRGTLPPAEFLDVAEETGLISLIDAFALRESCRQLGEWQQHACSPRMVSVNVSGRDFRDHNMVGTVQAAIEDAAIDPAALCIEITESTMLDTGATTVDALRRLRAFGCYLAIDDFGTGYSSLAAVRQLPVEVLKIDQTFVDGVATDPHDAAVVAAVMSLAQALGKHVVAEGVERPEQARVLLELGCTTVQGFLFARPMPAEVVTAVFGSGAADRRDEYARRRRVWAHRGERLFIDEFMHQMGIPTGDVACDT
jgi:diguanylate cyclase (GGDEF)-like protein